MTRHFQRKPLVNLERNLVLDLQLDNPCEGSLSKTAHLVYDVAISGNRGAAISGNNGGSKRKVMKPVFDAAISGYSGRKQLFSPQVALSSSVHVHSNSGNSTKSSFGVQQCRAAKPQSGSPVKESRRAYQSLPLPKSPAGFVLDDYGKVLMASSKRIATLGCGWIMKDDTHYMIYTPSDSVLFVAVKAPLTGVKSVVFNHLFSVGTVHAGPTSLAAFEEQIFWLSSEMKALKLGLDFEEDLRNHKKLRN
ncbi:hypothetical protein NE237_019102 [Protea cynaroides]|uniref:Uncharacterized protein n=1 Tax=Protea cynaroides TaxID=273540 RepID=A0A9Q0KB30_9MAGN|nr:hypothetical protein NE237_019102 [Protea cynaroides]